MTARPHNLDRSRLLTVLALFAGLLGCGSNPTRPGAAAEIHALTGARTRVVWVQSDGRDPFAMGNQLVLMGLDTDDGRGERVILGGRGSYVKPMLTALGDRIVYSTHPDQGDPSVHVANFDGSGARRFDRGFALALWHDPASGVEWVYVGSNHRNYAFSTITRVRLDQPAAREEVWNGAPISLDTFQLSPDGSLGGGLFPWPAAGVADLRSRTWKQLGEGCWTALNDAGTPLFWYFDGAHRNLLFVDVQRDRRWTVPINRAPGFDNPEVYHPRWSRHPRFMTMSGPYNRGGANQVRSGGTQAEIWIGRFSDDFTRIEAWARVTQNEGGDSYPDVWIDREATPYPLRASGRIGPAGTPDDADADRMIVEAKLIESGEVPPPESIAPYRHALSVNQYEIVNVIEGAPAGSRLLVAEWVIRDGRTLPARRSIGEVARLVIERYDAHPELEGERLIQPSGISDLPLHYAIEAAASSIGR